MKVFLLCSILTFGGAICMAQSPKLKQNNQWLEKQMNTLAASKEEGGPKFRFRDCDAKMEMNTGEEGFNLGMNLGTSWKEVQKVSYQKEKNGQYKLQLAMKDDTDNNGNWNFSLNTSDEKLVKEIKQRIEQNMMECSKK